MAGPCDPLQLAIAKARASAATLGDTIEEWERSFGKKATPHTNSPRVYRHVKTGNLYRLLAEGIDCTNDRDGTPVTIYCPEGDERTLYIRASVEFAAKFAPLP